MRRLLLLGFCILMPLSSFACIGSFFEVEKYGDDFNAFKKLCEDVNNNRGGTVLFPKGKTYIISIKDDYNGGHVSLPQDGAILLGFKGCNQVDVNLNGCTIMVAPNHSTKYAFAFFYDCKEFRLHNGKFIGDAKGHNYSPVIYNGALENSSHEWGYGVLVRGSNGIIEDMELSYMTGDGVYVGGFHNKQIDLHTSLTINNCDISYCRRNGISCASTLGFSLINTHIHHIGTYNGIKGTSPQAGIDFEYEDGVGDRGDIILKGCRITDCTQKVISASNSTPPVPDNFLIEDCYLEGSSFQVYHVKKAKSKVIRNCTVVRCPIHLGDADVENTKFDLGLGVHYVSGGHYKNSEFIGTLEKTESNYGCTLAGTNLNEAVFENCSFSDIRAANNNTPSYQGFAGYHFPLRAVFKNCTISNCSFVRGNEKNASSFAFYDSKLTDGCMIYNLSENIPITFERCELTDVSAYQTQTGRFIFKNSKLVQKDKSMSQPLLLFGNNSFERCTIVDEVGFPAASAKRHGVKAYKVEAVRTDFTFDSDNVKTEGMTLKRGKVHGVSKSSFKGTQRSVKFK